VSRRIRVQGCEQFLILPQNAHQFVQARVTGGKRILIAVATSIVALVCDVPLKEEARVVLLVIQTWDHMHVRRDLVEASILGGGGSSGRFESNGADERELNNSHKECQMVSNRHALQTRGPASADFLRNLSHQDVAVLQLSGCCNP
jgi:hypothetical protein